jgi:hypothetical protein
MKPRPKVVAGQIYGLWTVESSRIKGPGGHYRAAVVCACGISRTVSERTLYAGTSRSCGCDRDKKTSARRRKHGRAGTPEYTAWLDAIRRCHRRSCKYFAAYGGRGIHVCDRWRFGEGGVSGIECFIADMGERPDGLTLERIDVNLGYTPDNCKWASWETQYNNTRRSRVVEFNGRRHTAATLAKAVGLPYKTVLYRLDAHWSVEDIVARPAGWRPSKYRRSGDDVLSPHRGQEPVAPSIGKLVEGDLHG